MDAQQQRAALRLADAGLPPAGSFEAVARDWLATVHTAKVSTGHADRTRIRLEQDAFPWIGRRTMAEIEAPELLQCLRRVEARGAIETAHRLKDACGQVFRYGIAIGACTRNPAADLRDALGRAYNGTQFLDQRRQMMSAWADYLDRLRIGAQVVPIRAA